MVARGVIETKGNRRGEGRFYLLGGSWAKDVNIGRLLVVVICEGDSVAICEHKGDGSDPGDGDEKDVMRVVKVKDVMRLRAARMVRVAK